MFLGLTLLITFGILHSIRNGMLLNAPIYIAIYSSKYKILYYWYDKMALLIDLSLKQAYPIKDIYYVDQL